MFEWSALFAIEIAIARVLSLVIDSMRLDIENTILLHDALVEEIRRASLVELDIIGKMVEVLDSRIIGEIRDQTDTLTEVANRSEAAILGAVSETGIEIKQAVERSDQRIESTIERTAAEQTSELAALSGVIAGQLANRVNNVGTQVSMLSSQVGAQTTTLNNVLGAVLGSLQREIVNNITNIIQIDAGVFSDIANRIGGFFSAVAQSNENVLVQLGQTIGGALVDIGEAVVENVLRTNPELARIVEAILHNKDKNTKVIEQASEPSKEGLGAVLAQSVLEGINEGPDLDGDALREMSRVNLRLDTDPFCITGPFADFVKGQLSDEFSLRTIGSWVIAAASAIQVPMMLGAADAQSKLWPWQLCNPNNIPEVADAWTAWVREIAPQDRVEEWIRMRGYDGEVTAMLMESLYTIPPIEFLYNLWYRDQIDDDGLDSSLRSLGIHPGFIDGIKELAFFIPPVADLVTMAVREVFSPEIAAANGQFEDFPEQFEHFARQQGVSPEWAKNYWAAHWALPSVQMGYEMLHRGVINEEQLDGLMRALDIMPAWRERLTQISFSPFTRVDIRRMHDQGILNEDEVVRAYKDIGYDDDKAEKLKDFTVRLNSDVELISLDIAEDLTRSSIVNFYKDGIISRDVALALLIQAGINGVAAELFLDSADFDLERADRKADVDIVLDAFDVGEIDFDEAANRITALDLESRERELALLDLERHRIRDIKLPSRADLDRFVKGGIITDDEYLDQMRRLGFPDIWAGRYLELATA